MLIFSGSFEFYQMFWKRHHSKKFLPLVFVPLLIFYTVLLLTQLSSKLEFVQDILNDLKSVTGASVTDTWKANVTHVIAATDEHGACSRTLKVLMAMLGGKWVLNVECKYALL